MSLILTASTISRYADLRNERLRYVYNSRSVLVNQGLHWQLALAIDHDNFKLSMPLSFAWLFAEHSIAGMIMSHDRWCYSRWINYLHWQIPTDPMYVLDCKSTHKRGPGSISELHGPWGTSTGQEQARSNCSHRGHMNKLGQTVKTQMRESIWKERCVSRHRQHSQQS